MGAYSWVILTNCRAGRNREFEEWYDDIHIPDLLRVPGIVSAARGRAAPVQATMDEENGFALDESPRHAFQYVAIYKMETDDPKTVLQEVMRRAFSPEMAITDDLTNVQATLFEDV